jgi:hypothetical protein
MKMRVSFRTCIFHTCILRTCILGYLAMGLSGLTAAATFVVVDVAGATFTQINAINANGEVTGYYISPSDNHLGFLRTPDGTITTFGPPANTIFTDINPLAINSSGVIVGSVSSDQGCDSNPQCFQAFVRAVDGTMTLFSVNASYTTASAINSFGDIAGNFGFFPSEIGFLRTSDGTITTFDALPGAINDSDETTGAFGGTGDLGTIGFVRPASGHVTIFRAKAEPWWASFGLGINNSGLVVGVSQNDICEVSPFPGCDIFEIQGFLREPSGLITTFTVFGDPDTAPVGINSRGDVVGAFGIKLVGFVRDRSGLVTAFQAPNSYSTLPAAINDAGVVAGSFRATDQQSTHGFIRFP